MKSHLKIYNIEPHTEQWYAFRRTEGIGGSEGGTIVGVNKYDTAIRLFHEKIGTVPQKRDDNEAMFWGRTNEETIANVWQYYDGSQDGYIENFKAGKIVRKCRKVNGYVKNTTYPWLFASVDRLINKEGGFNLITSEPLQEEAILECKTLGLWGYKMWDDGIPVSYLIQIHIYMIIFETDYAEIATLVDGNKLIVEKIQRDEALCERILSITKDWWYNRVIPAREAKEKMDKAELEGNIIELEKNETIIQHCEPEPDGTDKYAEFMDERFLEERESIDGNIEMFRLAKKDRFLKQLENKVGSERTLIKNIFTKIFTDNGCETIDFGKHGNVNWSKRKGAQSRTFNNRLKLKPDDEVVDEEFNKIDLSF